MKENRGTKVFPNNALRQPIALCFSKVFRELDVQKYGVRSSSMLHLDGLRYFIEAATEAKSAILGTKPWLLLLLLT